MKQNIEDLLELSKETLSSYVKKAGKSGASHLKKSDAAEDKAMSTDGIKHPDRQKSHLDKAQKHFKKVVSRSKGIRTATSKMKEEVEQIEELSNTTYKSYSKKSSRDADKHINRFLKGGNEKSITHAEKRSKGINSAQQLMARKKMTVEEVEQIDEWKSIKGVDLEKVRADAKKNGKNVSLQHGEGDSLYKVVSPRKTQKEETEMEYNEEDGHIALVNAILDGNRDEANEIFDDVVSSRLNPVIAAKKEELAASMFATEEIEEEYIPLPLTEEAEHGHHHRIHANLTDSKNNLSNDTHNAYMSGNVTKEHKKDILKHVKSAEGSLDSAKSKLGSAESADHLNTAAVHITNGNAHLQNVRTYTSLGFRSY